MTMAVLVLALSACVLGDRKVMLKYPPATEKVSTPSAASSTAAAGSGDPIALARFADERDEKRIIGDTRNAFNMHMADVIAVNDVPDWVTGAVRSELERSGFTVIDEPPTDETVELLSIDGDVITVYTTAHWSYEADVKFHAHVRRGQEMLMNKVYSGEGSAGTNWAATEKSYGQSLALALQDASRKFVDDMKALATKATVEPGTSVTAAMSEKGRLSEADLRAILPGAVSRGTSAEGDAFIITYHANGALSGVSGTQTDSGNWEIQGDTVCTKWWTWRKGERRCFYFIKDGDWYTAYFTGTDELNARATIYRS